MVQISSKAIQHSLQECVHGITFASWALQSLFDSSALELSRSLVDASSWLRGEDSALKNFVLVGHKLSEFYEGGLEKGGFFKIEFEKGQKKAGGGADEH